MNLPKPPASYDPQDQAKARAAISKADGENIKQGAILNRFLMRDTATGMVVTVTIASGAFVIA